MLNTIKALIPTMILFCLMDYIWIGIISKNAYIYHLGMYLNVEQNQIIPCLLPAAVVYLLFAIMIGWIVLPLSSGKFLSAVYYGGLLGFIVYGIYDMTNLAVIKHWPTSIALTDWAWGIFLCSITSGFCAWLRGLL